MKKILFALAVMFCAAAPFGKAENNPYRSDYLWVVAPDHSDWLYKAGETPAVDVRIFRNGVVIENGTIEFSVANDMLDSDVSGEVVLKEGKATVKVATRMTPGFRDLRLVFKDPSSDAETRHHIKLGFDVNDIRPYTEEPSDFLDFWNAEIAKAREYALKPVIVETTYAGDGIYVNLVKFHIDRCHSVYGYVARPEGKTSCPVLFTPPGAGFHHRTWKDAEIDAAKKGFISMKIEIHGIDPRLPQEIVDELSATFISGETPYYSLGIENRDYAYMKHVYVATVRCVDYLTSLPEWDGKNVCVMGGSQGGALSIVSAALDSRVTQCVANYPAYSDMSAYVEPGRTGGYPHYNLWMPGILSKEVLETLPYYDVVNFAKHVTKAKTFIEWGYNDDTCPPTTSYAVWNSLAAPDKQYKVVPSNEHWHSREDSASELDWLVRNLK